MTEPSRTVATAEELERWYDSEYAVTTVCDVRRMIDEIRYLRVRVTKLEEERDEALGEVERLCTSYSMLK